MLTFKMMEPLSGVPRWRVFAGARLLGSTLNPGPSVAGMSWVGVAPDGTRFSATSRPKLAQKLLAHSAAGRQDAPR